MENASKALIMAGGVILAMLTIALLAFAWSKFSDFYSSDDELREIEDVAKFNEQFTAYDRTVSGYELVSLANKVADYNSRYADVTGAQNDKKYNPITLTISWGDNALIAIKKRDLPYIMDQLVLFSADTITQSDTKNQIKVILNEIAITERFLGDSRIASKVAKNIDNIDAEKYIVNKSISMDTAKSICLKNYNAMVDNSAKFDTYNELENWLKNGEMKKYYEYYQFKRAKFSCTNLTYDSLGRVSTILFNFTGEIE